MISSDMNTTTEPPAAAEEQSSAEGDPPRTCADISVEDGRWISVTGLPELIPDLVTETLIACQFAPESRTVSIALLSDPEVRSLNKLFRGKDTATNVLSFPSAPLPQTTNNLNGPIFIGDVALAYETVTEEASAQKKPVLNHAAHLIVHGVLHLAGFDHGEDAEAQKMETAERAILNRFGIPDPYADDALPLQTSL
jgi:probable rRNA maturation factor